MEVAAGCFFVDQIYAEVEHYQIVTIDSDF